MRRFIALSLGAGLLILAACASPTAPTSEDTATQRSGVVIRTG